jgi:hypothetical protein
VTWRDVTVRLRADVSQFQRGVATASATARGFARDLDTADSRMSNLVQTGLALGPALVPIGAAGIPAVAGLTSQLGFAVAAAGTTVMAFQGVGDALTALNDYQLEPTAENLAKVREEMATLGPAGQDFVHFLQTLRPEMQQWQNLAQEGLLPGMQDGIEEALELAPKVEEIISTISATLGDLMADAGDNLNDRRWAEFFDYLDREAGPTLTAMGRTFGFLVEGFTSMVTSFDPLSDMFRDGMLGSARDFRQWSDDLDDSQGFQNFVDYVRENGPRAMDTLGALIDAFVSLVQAAAPVGAAALPVIEAIAKTLSAIAESPAGPALIAAAAGISAIARAAALYKAANGSALLDLVRTADKDGRRAGTGLRSIGAGLGVIALSLTDVDDSLGLSNTAMGAAMGLIAGPWGAAIGGGIGLAIDFADSQARTAERVSAVALTLDQQTGAITNNTREWIKNELYTSGAFAAAERLGINLADLTDAALGNQAALALVNGQLDGFIDSTTGANSRLLSDSVFQRINSDATGLKETVNSTSGAIADGRDKVRQFGEAGASAGDLAAGGFDNATTAAERFNDAIREVNETLTRRAAFRDYEAALDDFIAGLDDVKNKARLLTKEGRINIDLPRARELQEQLDNIATTANRVAENLKGADRARFMARARADMVRVATLLLDDREAARGLADDLLALDRTNAKPTVKVDTSGAAADIANIHRALDNIPDETVFVNVFSRRSSEGQGTGLGPVGDHARGGYTGEGGKYESAGTVHRREFVFSSEATDGNIGLLQALHSDLRAGRGASPAVRHHATGSTVLTLGDLKVTGTLNTPWGPARVEGIARAAARDEIAGDRELESTLRGR